MNIMCKKKIKQTVIEEFSTQKKHVIDQLFMNGSTNFQKIKSAVYNPLACTVLIFRKPDQLFSQSHFVYIQTTACSQTECSVKL